MKKLGLKVDTTQERCCVMDQREFVVIGIISVQPYRLSTYPDKELSMIFLVADIPPKYGIIKKVE